MTITIHRPVRRPRLAIAVGLAAILVVAAFAIFQSTDTEAADTGAFVASEPVVSSATDRQMLRLQSLQDNYLAPTVTSAAAWMRLQSLQDNYLPAIPAPAESQTRTNQPR